MLTALGSNGGLGSLTPTLQDATGPSRGSSYAGGGSAALGYRQGANRGLQGLRFAPGVGQSWDSVHPLAVGIAGLCDR